MTAQAGAFTFASHAGLPIYPYYCRTLSLTLGRWCPLRATDVHALGEVDDFAGQNVYFYKNHMIKYVRLTGVIVSIDEFSGWIVLTLDDSSGAAIEAICAAPVKPAVDTLPGFRDTIGDGVAAATKTETAPITTSAVLDAFKDATSAPQEIISPDGPNLTNIDVGSVVKIKGGVGSFREQRQIRLKSIVILGDTNAEVKCWNDVVKFKREVLSSPWVVSMEDEERCRLDEDREAIWKKEEVAKQKKDQLKRHLKEKARELRDAQREREGRGEAVMEGECVSKRRQHKDKSSDVESARGREGREKRRKHREKDGELEGLREADIESKRTKGEEIDGGVLQSDNRANYLSRGARRRATGKYDALGI